MKQFKKTTEKEFSDSTISVTDIQRAYYEAMSRIYQLVSAFLLFSN